MSALLLTFWAFVGAGSAIAVLFSGRWGRRLFVALAVVQSCLSGALAIWTLLSSSTLTLRLWTLPLLGPLSVKATPLGAVFLLVSSFVFAVTAPPLAEDARELGRLRRGAVLLVLYQGLVGVTTLLLLAADVITFSLAWELMSLAVFALVSFRSAQEGVARAGFVTLAMSEAGTLAGIAGLLTLAGAAHSLRFDAIAAATPSLSSTSAWVVFVLALLGFGVKAGLIPMNAWLPDAHAKSPGTVPSLLTGVTLNLGFFAVLTVVGRLLPPEPGFGMTLLLLGAITAIVGMVYANTNAHLRHLLAHSSIENMGIAFAGAGGGLAFVALGHPVIGAMLLIAGVYQAINHAVYKTLLFIGVRGIESATGTSDMDELGGLLKRLPGFGVLFLAGTLAIAGLPPFNGFVSEWLTLEGLLRVVQVSSPAVRLGFAVAGALLALTAGLAVTCFVMVFGSTFAGMARTPKAAAPKKVSRAKTVPMALLATACLALGVLPTLVVPVLDKATMPIAHAHATAALVPPFFEATASNPHGMAPGLLHDLSQIGAQVGKSILPGRSAILLHPGGSSNPVIFAMSPLYSAVVLCLLLGSVYLVFWWLRRRHTVRRERAWAGGLPTLSPSMTYTATAFAAPVRVLFDAVFRPKVEERTEYHGQHFRAAIYRRETRVHIVDRLTLRPVARGLGGLSRLLARMHHGSVNAYAAYVLLSLLVVLGVALLLRPF
jgi:hydrogenase-4 component B